VVHTVVARVLIGAGDGVVHVVFRDRRAVSFTRDTLLGVHCCKRDMDVSAHIHDNGYSPVKSQASMLLGASY